MFSLYYFFHYLQKIENFLLDQTLYAHIYIPITTIHRRLIIPPPLHVMMEPLAPSDWNDNLPVSPEQQKGKKENKTGNIWIRFTQHAKTLTLVWTSRCENNLCYSTVYLGFNTFKSGQLNFIGEVELKNPHWYQMGILKEASSLSFPLFCSRSHLNVVSGWMTGHTSAPWHHGCV